MSLATGSGKLVTGPRCRLRSASQHTPRGRLDLAGRPTSSAQPGKSVQAAGRTIRCRKLSSGYGYRGRRGYHRICLLLPMSGLRMRNGRSCEGDLLAEVAKVHQAALCLGCGIRGLGNCRMGSERRGKPQSPGSPPDTPRDLVLQHGADAVPADCGIASVGDDADPRCGYRGRCRCVDCRNALGAGCHAAIAALGEGQFGRHNGSVWSNYWCDLLAACDRSAESLMRTLTT